MTKKTSKKPKPFAPVRIARSTQPNPKDDALNRMPERAAFSPKDHRDAVALLATVSPDQQASSVPVIVHVPVPLDEEHIVVAVPRSTWRKITDAMGWTTRDE